MIKKIKKYLLPAGQRRIKTQQRDEQAEFSLLFDDMEVGRLIFDGTKWIFKYSDDFKKDQPIKPLANFPDLSKTYESESLWPFFSSRIPSLSRKSIVKRIKKNNIDSSDMIALLKLFGANSITNPFRLEVR
jgi:HipA-like protein